MEKTKFRLYEPKVSIHAIKCQKHMRKENNPEIETNHSYRLYSTMQDTPQRKLSDTAEIKSDGT